MTKTVLIVDDNAFIRQALCKLFEREDDFEVCGEAEDGQGAIAAAMCLYPDLVVLDVSMPVMSGLDAARVLRTLNPTLPLILYSADADRPVELQARSLGISDLVSKTAPVSVLISRARRLLYPGTYESAKKGNSMDEALKAKLDEARQRMNSQQAGINTGRQHDDRATREWARGKQRPANAERAQFRDSLTDEDRGQIEERIQQLVDDNPALSPTNTQTLDSKTEPSCVSLEVLDEYHFLRDMVS